MSHAPLHCSDEDRQGAGHELCYHCTLSGLSCMHMQSHSIVGLLRVRIHQSSSQLMVGYNWKLGVRPCPVISGSGLTHCLAADHFPKLIFVSGFEKW